MELLPPGSRVPTPTRCADVDSPGRVEKKAPEATPIPSNGLVNRARPVERTIALPAGVRCVRRATPEDAEAIAEIQSHYELRKIDAADHPANGWLVQKSAPEAIRFAMRRYKDFWVAENDEGRVIAFQAVSAARFISRPADKHKFLGPFGRRARRVIESGRFIYMSQIATDPEFRGKGLAAALQATVLERYRDYPLVAHVAVFTQDDFDARPRDGSPFEPRFNNIASHKFHQKLGYRLVGYTSDLAGTTEYNTGLTPPDRGAGELPGIVGALYVNFRDGADVRPPEYTEPVDAILDTPCLPGHGCEGDWENPFSPHWPDPDDLEAMPAGSPGSEAKLRTELIRLWEPPTPLP